MSLSKYILEALCSLISISNLYFLSHEYNMLFSYFSLQRLGWRNMAMLLKMILLQLEQLS